MGDMATDVSCSKWKQYITLRQQKEFNLIMTLRIMLPVTP